MKSALEQALASLSRRALTRHELVKRLAAKGYSEEQIQEALQKVTEWGYIDDRRLAFDICQTRQERNSRRRISEDLRLRGIEATIVEQALQTYPVEEEFRSCFALAEQFWHQEKARLEREQNRSKNRPQRKPGLQPGLLLQQRVGRKLMYRGYSYELIHDVLRQIAGKEE